MTGVRLTGGTVLAADGDTGTTDVTVRTGPSAGAAEAAGDVVDVTGQLVLPGLANAHDHLRSLLPATREAETMPLPAIIERAGAAGAAATAEHYRDLTAQGAARMVLSGVTSAIDHIYPVHVPGMIEAAAAGHDRVGLRASLAVGLMDSGHPAVLQDPSVTIDDVARIADDAVPADRLFLAPVSLRQSSPDVYRAAVSAADRLGMRLYTHVAESAAEVDACLAEHGMRPVELLHSLGFLRPGTVLVHCVHLDERERQLVADTGTAVAYCPSNHLRFAKGFAPIRDLIDRGVTVGLGIDGMVDGFTEIRQAVYAQAQAAGATGVLTSAEAFRMATTAAASLASGDRADPAADPTPGAWPDAVVASPNRLELQPVADPLWTLIHRMTGTDVTDVYIGGKAVVRDGQLTRVSHDEVAERAAAATAAIASAAGVDLRPGGEHAATPPGPAGQRASSR
ncbi:amidohydrolase family protein [Haloactinopolyspora alba]|uniref:amidohydrolase family protein n=1 Tax=Haloactinopolyspora alba TaxID=648780 RepID=UPI0013EE3561|nr:amidohydrolase family protein [Haloactinopolyspora alba]